MISRGHIPERMCAGCGRRSSKGELIRLLATGDGMRIVLDPGGSQGGRGTYVCPSIDCFDAGVKRRSFQRRLRSSEPGPELREEFIRLIEGE